MVRFCRFGHPWRPRPRELLLIDGAGALLTIICLLLVIRWQPVFGMPTAVLCWLLPVPVALAFTSLMCFWLMPGYWRKVLRTIAGINLTYGVITVTLVGYYRADLTIWGFSYFTIEALVLFALAYVEFKTAAVGVMT